MKFINNNLIAISYRSDSALKIFEHHLHLMNGNGDSINHLVDKYRFDCIAVNQNEEIIIAGVHIYKFGPGANDYFQYPAIRKWDKNLNLI
jgi:hypothetical protein